VPPASAQSSQPAALKHTPLHPPIVVAIAQDAYLKPKHPFGDPIHLKGLATPKYGQDFTFGNGRVPRNGQDVGKTPAELAPKMRKLLHEFARGDNSGMAKRLVETFLQKQGKVSYFEDAFLTIAAAKHPHIESFCRSALGAPGSPAPPPAKKRIHQALKDANWDITKLVAPTDLGVPALNTGSTGLRTKDYNNGLGLMINGIQYAYVLAHGYAYDPQDAKYWISLKYIFYDVFGLDDDDLDEYGVTPHFSTDAQEGITAWWQLQHQHGYAPLVTRIVLEKSVEVAAT
jgi:hypothetical protein